MLKFAVGQYVYHGWRYWKTDGLASGEVAGWNTEYRRYLVTRITPKRIVVFWESGSEPIHEVQLNRATMEREGKQYHTRFHEYFYAEKPAPDSKDWNWAGSKLTDSKPSFIGDCLTILNLSLPCTRADVRRAYKRLAKTAHPDRGGTQQAFIKLKQAHDSALRFATV